LDQSNFSGKLLVLFITSISLQTTTHVCSCVENFISDDLVNSLKNCQKWETQNQVVLPIFEGYAQFFCYLLGESWHLLTTPGVALVNDIEHDTIVWQRIKKFIWNFTSKKSSGRSSSSKNKLK